MGEKIKRQAVFEKLKRKGSGIFLLQETHCTKDKEAIWKRQWGCQNIIFSNGTSSSRGVAILFTKDIEFVIEKEFIDPNGRYIIIDIKIENETLTVINLYSPTRNFENDQIEVFLSLIQNLNEMNFTMEHIILGADMNV